MVMAAEQHLAQQFAQSLQNQSSEFDVAMLVAQVIDDQVDVAGIRNRFSTFIEPALSAGISDTQDLLELFTNDGFGQSRLEQVGLSHSSLDWVLSHKEGIPISLAVLLIEASHRCGISGFGVNFPGHFLVSMNDQLVDPLRMQIVDPAAILGTKLDAREARHYMQPASAQMVGLRMLNNLKAQFLQHQKYTQALDVVDYQLALCGDDEALCATLHYERGEFWQQLGAFAVAREAYGVCRATTTDTELAQQAELRMQALSNRGETLH